MNGQNRARGPAPQPDARATSTEILERRLNDGYQRIEDAKRAGQDVTEWTSFWIDLLKQYESEATRDYDEWIPL